MATPTITSFSPDPNLHVGESVVITGTNFTGATSVRFNGVDATSFTINSATQITAVVTSDEAARSYSIATYITVISPDGTATSSDSYVILPTILTISPNPAMRGNPISLTGTALDYPLLGASVSFPTAGGGRTTNGGGNTDTTATTGVPAGAVSGLVTYRTLFGESAGFSLTITEPPPGTLYPASGLTANSDSAGIHLNWTASPNTGATYDIYRGTVSGSLGFLGSTGSTTYLDPVAGLIAGTRYYYRVYARLSGATSAGSNEASAVAESGTTIPTLPPAPPAELEIVPYANDGTLVNVILPPLPSGAVTLGILLKIAGDTFGPARTGLLGGDQVVITNLTPDTDYIFAARSENSAGNTTGPELWVRTVASIGAEAPVDSAADAPTVEWVAPPAGAVAGRKALIAHVTTTNGLDPTAPVVFIINGGTLPATRVTGTNYDGQWRAYYDFGGLNLNGALQISAVATGRNGKVTTANRTFDVNSSLNDGIIWHDNVVQAGEISAMAAKGEKITKVAATADFDPAPDIARDRFWTVQVISPDSGALDRDTTTAAELLADTAKYQPLELERIVPLIGAAPATGETAYTPSDNTARLRFIGTPVERLDQFPTGCSYIPKMRQIGDDAVEIFGVGDPPDSRCAFFSFTKSGLALICDLTAKGYPYARDAAHAGDKLHIVSDSDIIAVDLDAGSVDELRRPVGEEKPARFVEHCGDFIYWFYADDSTTTVYRRTNTDASPVDSMDLTSPVAATWTDGTTLFFALANHKIYRVTGSTAPVLVRTHDANVTAFDALHFGDENGRIYLYDVPDPIADISPYLRALSIFKGADTIARGVAAGDDVQLYRPVFGIYTPVRTIPGTDTIPSLGHLAVELITASGGGGLQGGTDEVTAEWLIGGSETGPGAAFVWRLQESTPTDLRGSDVENIALKVMGKAKI